MMDGHFMLDTIDEVFWFGRKQEMVQDRYDYVVKLFKDKNWSSKNIS